jgi:hypothetical protein
MAYLMDTDDRDVIHAATHGMLSRNDLNFLRERMGRVMSRAGAGASEYLTKASERLSNFNLGKLRDKVDAFRDRFDTSWKEDRIVEMMDIGQMQQAKPTMRRYVMADPRIQRLFESGRTDGYGKLYTAEEPGCYGRDNQAYREYMNGAHDEVDGEDRWTTYLEIRDEDGDEPLKFEEKVAIRNSIENIHAEFDRGKQDPLSPVKKTL